MNIQIRGLDELGTVNRKRKTYISFRGHQRHCRNHLYLKILLSTVSTVMKTTRLGKILSRILKWYPIRAEKITYLKVKNYRTWTWACVTIKTEQKNFPSSRAMSAISWSKYLRLDRSQRGLWNFATSGCLFCDVTQCCKRDCPVVSPRSAWLKLHWWITAKSWFLQMSP